MIRADWYGYIANHIRSSVPDLATVKELGHEFDDAYDSSISYNTPAVFISTGGGNFLTVAPNLTQYPANQWIVFIVAESQDRFDALAEQIAEAVGWGAQRRFFVPSHLIGRVKDPVSNSFEWGPQVSNGNIVIGTLRWRQSVMLGKGDLERLQNEYPIPAMN